MKRDQTFEHVTPPLKLPRTSTTILALHIVLRHWMVLDLGWSTKYFDEWLVRLREKIIVDRIKNVPAEDRCFRRTELMFQLEKEFGYFDETYVDAQASLLTTVPADVYLLQKSSGVPVSYTADQMSDLLITFFTEHVSPIAHMIQHQWITYVLQLRETFIHIHSVAVQLFLQHQQKYQHCEAIIVSQLVCWKQLEVQLEPMELLVYCMAFIPFKLHHILKGIYDIPESKVYEDEYAHEGAIELVDWMRGIANAFVSKFRSSEKRLCSFHGLAEIFSLVTHRLELLYRHRSEQLMHNPQWSTYHQCLCSSFKQDLHIRFHECCFELGTIYDCIGNALYDFGNFDFDIDHDSLSVVDKTLGWMLTLRYIIFYEAHWHSISIKEVKRHHSFMLVMLHAFERIWRFQRDIITKGYLLTDDLFKTTIADTSSTQWVDIFRLCYQGLWVHMHEFHNRNYVSKIQAVNSWKHHSALMLSLICEYAICYLDDWKPFSSNAPEPLILTRRRCYFECYEMATHLHNTINSIQQRSVCEIQFGLGVPCKDIVNYCLMMKDSQSSIDESEYEITMHSSMKRLKLLKRKSWGGWTNITIDDQYRQLQGFKRAFYNIFNSGIENSCDNEFLLVSSLVMGLCGKPDYPYHCDATMILELYDSYLEHYRSTPPLSIVEGDLVDQVRIAICRFRKVQILLEVIKWYWTEVVTSLKVHIPTIKFTLEIVKTIPFDSIITTLSKVLQWYMEGNNKTSMDVADSAMAFLLHYGWWADILLSVEIMRIEMMTSFTGNQSLPNTITQPFVAQLSWINEMASNILSLRSTFEHALRTNSSTPDVIKWLEAPFGIPHIMQFLIEDQRKVISTMQQVANSFKLEIDKYWNSYLEEYRKQNTEGWFASYDGSLLSLMTLTNCVP